MKTAVLVVGAGLAGVIVAAGVLLWRRRRGSGEL